MTPLQTLIAGEDFCGRGSTTAATDGLVRLERAR
jgi:hypothetical protein